MEALFDPHDGLMGKAVEFEVTVEDFAIFFGLAILGHEDHGGRVGGLEA